MKKLLYLLGSIALTAPVSSGVVSCFGIGNNDKSNFDWGNNTPADTNSKGTGETSADAQASKVNQVKNQEWEKVLNGTYKNTLTNLRSYGTTTNDLLHDNVTNFDDKLEFDPYADAGIVNDTVEYYEKDKGLSGAHYNNISSAFAADDSGITNVEYNNLKDYVGTYKPDGIKLGFMQNASDSGEISPMFNAAPSKGVSDGILADTGKGTEYADWFNKRIDEWGITDTNHKNFATISFGPFANSLWHEAWKNNKTPEELAEVIAKVGKRYNTNKFDFYFAAPYLSHAGNYYDSQILLAAALKVLMDADPTYDITLSLVTSTQAGLALQEGWNGKVSSIGDEISPLYSFTKFLGMNFRLNLVPYLTVSDYTGAALNTNWETKDIEDAVDNSFTNWLTIYSNLSGNKLSSNQIEEDKTTYSRHIAVTPWIGRRAEKAAYNLTPAKALELEKWATEKEYGQISMFYVSRDNPSEFEKRGEGRDNLADDNPLDQNIRSGGLWDKGTFSNIFNGSLTDAPDEAKDPSAVEHTTYEQIKNFPVKDEWKDDNSGSSDWSDPATPDGGGGGTPSVPGASASLYTSQESANPNRTSKITSKSSSDGITYFSPYVDAGLYQGNDIGDVNSTLATDGNGAALQGLTLAFVQQSNSTGNDKLDLSIAGISDDPNDENYKWWESSMLWAKMLEPMAKAGKFDMVKVAYGGASTGANTEKNPWNVAYEMANGDTDKAADLLVTALKGFQEKLQTLAKSNGYSVSLPKSIDFDIEGNAQNDTKQLKVLATALAKMKASDSSWDFSITLPTLDTGLTTLGYSVLDTFVKIYKEKGIDQKDIPVTNLMLMDYGNAIYDEAINKGETDFDLAKNAIEATRNNIATSINSNYGKLNNQGKDLYTKIGATPMIGVNDTVSGVFTLEDAKELYNYANTVGLAYIGMWSLNDDRGKVNGQASIKSLVSHGLTYLSDYDFTEAFSGIWSDKVLGDK